MTGKPILLILGAALATSLSAPADAPQDPEAIRFFENRIRPLLAARCYECHGEEKQKGGLRLDNLGYILEGGDAGPVLVPGDSGASHMFRAVTWQDPDYEMPPDEKLPDAEIADLKRWIDMGAPWPQAEVIPPRQPGGFTAEERAWWSFQPVEKSTPPAVDESKARIAGDVDRFIVARLQENKLQQAPEAETHELLRRVYYNLHGLPPDENQITAYLADTRQDKWDRLVDELLASPRYGVRWGQHWLDLVRYAESDGYREDAYRPHAWPYRDYVIRSFNEDKPYDRFVREQLAGDEIDPENPDVLIATAFLRHGIYEWNQADAEMQRDIIIKEMPGLTGEVFLGMSVGCAECHDHKFDPILQKDYYRFRSFFEPLMWRDDLPLATPEEKTNHAAAMAAWTAEAAEAAEAADALAAWDAEKQRAIEKGTAKALAYFPPAVQEMHRKPADQRTPAEKQVLYLVDRRIAVEIGRALDPLKPKSAAWAAYKPFEDRKPKPLQPAFAATDVGPDSPPTIMTTRRGQSTVTPGFLSILAPADIGIEPLPHIASTGRRSALADWITDPSNPLATRVIVNRVWQHHFGRGLSEVASDLGRLGEPPSHPELLDWLTTGFIENGWSMKWLHRQILRSATYRQSSLVESTPLTNNIDPTNRLLWRFRPQRLDAEQLRDTLLTLSGELKPMSGGPAEEGWKPVPSAYVRKQRNSPDEFLSRFDAPPGFQSVARRDATNTALQSLLLVNAEWPMQRARSMASRLLTEHPHADPTLLSSRAIRLAFGRPSDENEAAHAAEFLLHQEQLIQRERENQTPASTSSPLVDGAQWFPTVTPSGEPSLVFTPGTAHEKIRIQTPAPEDLAFSIEAVVWLDSLQPDSSVRTIASRWNGSQATDGWAFGVTGKNSKLGASQLIMQLVGGDFQAARALEVLTSGITLPLRTPYYVAAYVSPETLPGRPFGGHIRFIAKNLADPSAEVIERKIPHALGSGYINPERALVAGGRDGPGHLWSGGIHRLVISRDDLLPENALSPENPIIDLRGSAMSSAAADAFTWISPQHLPAALSPKLEALADLFHVLINSNEFLYQP